MAVRTDQHAKAQLTELTLQTRRAESRNVETLVVISLIATTGFLWLRRQHPQDGTLELEAAKAALQILSVAVLGGIISTAAFQFQRSRTDLAEWQKLEDERQEGDRKAAEEAELQNRLREEDRREREHVRAEDRRDRQAERWRRDRKRSATGGPDKIKLCVICSGRHWSRTTV